VGATWRSAAARTKTALAIKAKEVAQAELTKERAMRIAAEISAAEMAMKIAKLEAVIALHSDDAARRVLHTPPSPSNSAAA
jgi:hypothetical protein